MIFFVDIIIIIKKKQHEVKILIKIHNPILQNFTKNNPSL